MAKLSSLENEEPRAFTASPGSSTSTLVSYVTCDGQKEEQFMDIELSKVNTTSTVADQKLLSDDNDCPDGGLRAWLVVAGVSYVN